MRVIILLLTILGFSSCKTYTKFYKEELPKNDTIYVLNLSNRNLKTQPDLSEYTIIDLDLSSNKISKFEETKLPKGLQKLNLSGNKLKGHVFFKTLNNFENLNFSKNKIEYFTYNGVANNLNLSKNKLKYLYLIPYNDFRAEILNVADNKNLETQNWNYHYFYKKIINYSISTKN